MFKCELIIVRHGETEGESSVRFYGSTDIALSEIGIQQMIKTARKLREFSFERIITSPLKRSYNTVQFFQKEYSEAKHVIVDSFSEIYFGQWEGLTAGEIAEQFPVEYDKWRKSIDDFSFPKGESISTFIKRVTLASKKLFCPQCPVTLAVLHKGVIKVVLSVLLNKSYTELLDYNIELGSIQYLKKEKQAWELLKYNDTEHLGDIRISHSY